MATLRTQVYNAGLKTQTVLNVRLFSITKAANLMMRPSFCNEI